MPPRATSPETRTWLWAMPESPCTKRNNLLTGVEFQCKQQYPRSIEMKRVLSVALILISFAFVAQAQTSMTPAMQNAPARKSPLEGYAGSWIGMLEGHAWITVKLNKQGPDLTGTIQRPKDL